MYICSLNFVGIYLQTHNLYKLNDCLTPVHHGTFTAAKGGTVSWIMQILVYLFCWVSMLVY